MIVSSPLVAAPERFSRIQTVLSVIWQQQSFCDQLLLRRKQEPELLRVIQRKMVEFEDRIYKYWLPPFLKRLQRNRSAPPPRTALAALFLTTVGLVVIVVGLYEKWYDVGPDVPYHYFTLFLLGFITFVPGSYATFNLWGAFRRWPQFEYDQVPSWDDQALT